MSLLEKQTEEHIWIYTIDMMSISSIEESDRDWDWYASDPDAMVGHFTTAGIRGLPRTVRQDREAAFRLIHYFDVEAPKSAAYVVRPEVEMDVGGWKDAKARSWYLSSFEDMASKGLFSYDTFLSGPDEYHLVAFAQVPLHISELPPDIRELVKRTKSPHRFAKFPYLSGADTLNW